MDEWINGCLDGCTSKTYAWNIPEPIAKLIRRGGQEFRSQNSEMHFLFYMFKPKHPLIQQFAMGE
ncbi:MAG TPA: hypothetical protein DET40_06740 [Lentisphaeria bacterium]|nr:MAG: hypothetical protein A2X45_07560 [Lentisphaerae bacterium GWF2_50_93]HCE43226.1 hypothetical protein [Lentisphaeria bacterium]